MEIIRKVKQPASKYNVRRNAYECECPRCHEIRTYYKPPREYTLCNVCNRKDKAEKLRQERELLAVAKENLTLLFPKMTDEMQRFWLKERAK